MGSATRPARGARIRITTCVATTVLAASGLLALPAPAGAATTPSPTPTSSPEASMVEGKQLPWLSGVAVPLWGAAVAGGHRFTLLAESARDGYGPYRGTLVDLETGGTRTVESQVVPPRAMGASVLTAVAVGTKTRWSTSDPATGAVQGSWDLRPQDSPVVAGPDWIAFPSRGKDGPTMTVRRKGKPDLTYTRPAGAPLPSFAMADPATLVVRGVAGGTRILDTRTWQETLVGTLPKSASDPIVGPTHLFWVDAPKTKRAVVHWRLREDPTWHEVTPEAIALRSWVAFGSGLAQIDTAKDGTRALRPVDLATGKADAPAVADLSRLDPRGEGAVALGDGAVAVVQRRSTGFSLVTAAPGQPTRVVSTAPQSWLRPTTLAVGADIVTATADTVAYASAADPSAQWGAVPRVDGAAVPGSALRVEGGTVLSVLPGSSTYQLTWPGGHRQLTGVSNVVLYNGGRLVGYVDSSGERVLAGARTGALLGSADLRVASTVVQGWRWWRPGTSGRPSELLVTDYSADPPVTTTVRPTLDCEGITPQAAADRWVMITCRKAGFDSWWVLDSRGVVREQQVWGTAPLLGPGYTVTRTALPSGVIAVQVRGLATGAVTVLGPSVANQLVSLRQAVALDPESGTLAYLDGALQPRWLTVTPPDTAPAGTPDVTAPTVTVTGPAGDVVQGSALPVSWTGSDPRGAAGAVTSGVDRYELRFRQAPTRDGAMGLWTDPSPGIPVIASTFTLPAPSGSKSCVLVRAIDGAGNVGDWSSERCWITDAKAPVITSASLGSRLVQSLEETTLPFAFTATDDDKVLDYDVQTRVARLGEDLGGWQDHLLNQTQSPVPVLVPSSWERCARVRARDAVGNVGEWSTQQCATVPLDDRRLGTVSGTVTRPADSRGLGGTVTVLESKGAEVSSFERYTGTSMAVQVLRGPGQGAVDVYLGTTKLGRISLAAAAWSRDYSVLKAPQAFRDAQLRIVLVTDAPARIDAQAGLKG